MYVFMVEKSRDAEMCPGKVRAWLDIDIRYVLSFRVKSILISEQIVPPLCVRCPVEAVSLCQTLPAFDFTWKKLVVGMFNIVG